MATQLRLDKLLSDTGRWSRKEAKLLLKQGRVRVDAQVEHAAERKVDPASQRVEVDGALVIWAKFRYLMLNKPGGVLTATEDRRQKTVLDLLPEEYRSLFPVGRLDKDTEGLLLLTNDGPLAHRLLSPRHHVDKKYYVEVAGALDGEDCRLFREGITLADGYTCQPAELELLDRPAAAYVTLHEGKYHQIKRMLASRGKPVTYLKRVTFGPLKLDETLEIGCWRLLTDKEKSELFRQ